MSGLGPPRGWRGSNAWASATPQRSVAPASGDHLERLEAMLKPTTTALIFTEDDVADQRAAVAELKRLRAELETLRRQLGKPKTQHRAVSLQLGTIVKLNTDDLRRRNEWIEGTRHEVRTVYRTPWREAEDGDWMATGGVIIADSAPILNDGCTFPVPLDRPASDNPPTITITTYEPTPETHDRMRQALLGHYMRTSRGKSKRRGKP